MKARQASGLNVGMYGLCLAGLWVGSLIATATAGDLTTDNLTVRKNATVYDKLIVESMSASAPTNGLILYYTFDSNTTSIADASGNGVTGTAFSGTAWTSAGLKNGAFTFNGSSGDIETPPPCSPWVSNQVSVSLWAKYNTASGTRILFSISQTLDNSGSKFWLESGGWGDSTIRFAVQNVSVGVGSGLVPQSGQWYHIAGTYDGASLTIYINGTLCARAPLTYSQSSTAKIRIGYDVGQSGFSGTLDEVRVYNRALSGTEVMGLYNHDQGAMTNTAASITVQNSIQQTSAVATNTFMGLVRIGTQTNGAGEKLLVNGNVLITGQLSIGESSTNVGSVVTYGGLTTYVDEAREVWQANTVGAAYDAMTNHIRSGNYVVNEQADVACTNFTVRGTARFDQGVNVAGGTLDLGGGALVNVGATATTNGLASEAWVLAAMQNPQVQGDIPMGCYTNR